MSIERDSHISMYVQIATLLEDAIHSGAIKPDQKLPTEAEIMEQYNVSRITARLAIKSLHEKGLVVRKQGKGTFVSENFLHQELGQMEGFYDSFLAKDLDAQLAEMKVMDTPEEVKGILGDAFARTLFLKRIYVKDGEVLGYSNVYMPLALTKTVTWEIAEKHSGYSLLTKFGSFELKNATLAIRSLPADPEQADSLKIREHEPILRIARTSFTQQDAPIEHTRLFLRADKSELNLKVPGHFSIVNGLRETFVP